MEPMTATTASEMKAASELYNRDARARAIATSAAAMAMDMVRDRLDPDAIEMRDVQDVALNAAVLATKRIYEGDAEIFYLRAERDHYKKLALGVANLTPPQIISREQHST